MGKKYLDVKKGSLEESILDIWQTAAEETGTKMDGRTKGYKSHRSKLESRKTKREEKKAVAKEVYEIGTDEYREYLERLTPGETIKEGTKEEYQKFFNAAMKKFKIDSPADLKSDEEKKKFFDYVDKNYKGEKDEELIQLAREFKISSMKEAIAKVWNFNEKVLHVFRVTSKNKQGNVHAKDEKEAVKKAKAKGMKGDIKVTDMGVYKGQPTLEDKEDEDKEVSGNKTLTGKKAAVVEVDPKSDLEKKKKSGNPDH